ncbi:uncharacterized protein LOC110511695 [Oncorhynchus mykiss]|uniref:ALMS motif domain-containing protein n=1 Tax=Oncorhynchus mykiss TaxID=8022 RepID=A0A8K9Y004_ONCMY|nr:uncharacterized protein LOC110511695 [Oncorhynchus mykiss]
MNLRGPSAHPGARRGQDPGWRRSWEPSHWDGLMSEVEVVPRHTGLTGCNPPRQQSARDGGSHSQNLDRCLQELERVQCQTYFKGGSPVSLPGQVQCQTYFKGGSPVSSPGQVSKVELVPPSPPQLTPARTPRPHSAIEGRRQMNEWLYELEKMQSGDYFDGSPTDSPEVEPHPKVHLGRTPRPQSAIEGGSQNLDRWLQELERMENGRYFGNPDRVQRDQVQAPFYDGTASMPTLHKEPVGSGLRHHYQGLPSSPSLCSRDRDLSPCGTPSPCDSSLGSQESLKAGLSSAQDYNGSWERAIIKQAPGKEEAKLSSLTPVRVGWLPIQRRALLRDAPGPGPRHPHLQVNVARQVRLKPAITPTFRKNPVRGNVIKPVVEGEVEKVEWSKPIINTVGLRTRWLPDQAPSPSTQHQVSGKESSVPRERDNRSLGWQDQRRSWASRTTSHLSGSGTPTQSNNSLPGANTNSEPARKSPLHSTTSNNQQPSHTEVPPYGTSSQSPGIQPGDDSDSEPCWRSSLHRTNSFQTSSPSTIRPTVQNNPSHTEITPSGTKSAPYRSNNPLCRTNSVQQKPSHAELTPYRTSSEPYRATSLQKRTSCLPQTSPAGVVSPPAPRTTTGATIVLKTTTPAFSSITIATKKISRTTSLPGSRPLSPGSRAPRPQSYHSDEARVPGYKAPRPQSYHCDEAIVPGYKTPRPQSYHCDEARVPGYKTPRPQSYHCDEARVPGYKTPRPQSYHTNQSRLSTTCTSVTQQDQVHHHHPTGNDPSSTPVTLRRKSTATIVKVTEHRRMTSEPVNRLNGRQSPVSSVSGDQPNDQGTAVHRRKATVIKVTEHRESYSPGQDASGVIRSSSRPSEYRHSYTEGVYTHKSPWQQSPWQQGAMNSNMNSVESLQSTPPSQYLLESSMGRIDRPNSALFLTPNKSTSTTTVALRDPEGSRGGGKPIQKSTLMLFINPSSPSSRETSIEKVGVERGGEERRARDRARRPASCYANVFGHTDPTEPCPVSETVTVTQAGPGNWSPESVTQAGPGNWSPETVTQAGPGNWSPETVTQAGPRNWSPETVTQAGPGNWSPETVTQAGPGNWSPETVTQAGPGNWSPETVTQAGPGNWSPETVTQAGPGNWSPETVTQAGPRNWSPVTVTQAGPGIWSPETVTQAGPGNWSPETVTVTQTGPRNWSPKTVTQAGPGNWSPETVTQAGPRNWSPETVTQAGPRNWSTETVTQAGPGNWSPETVTQAGPGNWSPETVTQAGPGNWSPETVTQAGPGHWSMGHPNQTQNSNIDPVRDRVKDTATSNSRLNTGSSSSSISAGPAGRDREMCPPETESSRPEGRGTEREGDVTHHSHQADARSSQPQPPAITLIKHQEPQSHQQSPEAVLALNAAAVIAHIKLQRQLSLRKATPHDLSTRSPTTPEEGKTLVKDAGGCVRPRTDDNRLDPGETTRTTHHTTQIDVGFIPLNSDSDPETSKANIPSPREALERSRPHFISRSQGRLREMERRAEERREERRSDHQPEETMLMHHGGHSTRTSPLSDNLFRPRDRAITGKEMHLRTRQNYKNLPEVRRKQEEEKRREDYLTNRLRADLFKKKLLEQILQRARH